jgi:hypothetical protein
VLASLGASLEELDLRNNRLRKLDLSVVALAPYADKKRLEKLRIYLAGNGQLRSAPRAAANDAAQLSRCLLDFRSAASRLDQVQVKMGGRGGNGRRRGAAARRGREVDSDRGGAPGWRACPPIWSLSCHRAAVSSSPLAFVPSSTSWQASDSAPSTGHLAR